MAKDPLVVAGGNAILYASSLTLDLRKKSIGDGEPITREEGIKIGVTVKKNHNTPGVFPYVKTDYYAVFGEGIEQILTTLDKAINQGIIRKAGAWLYWDDEGHSWQGKAQYRQFMRENPAIFEQLTALVHGEVIQVTGKELEEIKAEEEMIEEQVTGKKRGRKSKTVEPVSEETEKILESLDEEPVNE